MLAVGERVPHATVWVGPREPLNLSELLADGRSLLVPILFAWSST